MLDIQDLALTIIQGTEIANALTATSWFYVLYSHTSERHNNSNHPTLLEFFSIWTAVPLSQYLIIQLVLKMQNL